MKKISINRPIDIEVVNKESRYDGVFQLRSVKSGLKYDVTVVEPGSELSESVDSYITFYANGGNSRPLGGNHARRVEPRYWVEENHGRYRLHNPMSEDSRSHSDVMPRAFSVPYEMKYEYGQAGAATKYGQSSKGVNTYNRIKLAGPYAQLAGYLAYRPQMISFKGDLYFACEMQDTRTSDKQHVRLYKHNEQTDEFELIQKFDDLLVDDISDVDGEVARQNGSPTMCVADGELILAYRFVDRNEEGDTNNIAVWRTSDTVEWHANEFEVPNTSTVNYNKPSLYSVARDKDYSMNDHGFRLRVAYGGGVLMVVYAGVKDSPDKNIQYRDMRSMASYNFGRTFEVNQSSFSQFTQLRDEHAYELSSDYVGMFTQFISSSDYDDDVFTRFSVNFDLYYDQRMGSFVIMKGGDPKTTGIGGRDGEHENAGYLVGIKTLPGDYLSWEPCLSIDLDFKTVNGLKISSWPFRNIRAIHDVKVVSHETRCDLFMVVSLDSKYRLSRQTFREWDERKFVVVHAEFCFVSDRLIERGYYPHSFLAYGAKTHDEFMFCSSPIDPVMSGFVTSAGQTASGSLIELDEEHFGTVHQHDLYACRHRNQTVFGAKNNVDNRWSLLGGYAVTEENSNLTEVMPYQFNYTPHVLPLSEWGFSAVESNGGSVDWTNTYDATYMNWCYASSVGDQGYFESVLLNEFVETVDDNDYWKIKFSFMLKDFGSATAGSVRIAQIGNASFSSFLALEITYDGTLTIVDDTGSTVAQLMNKEPVDGIEYEVIVHRGYSMNANASRFMFWVREKGGDWVPANNEVDSTIDTTKLRLGWISGTGFDGVDLGIGSVQIGFPRHLSEPVFTESRGLLLESKNDGTRRGQTAFDYCNNAEYFSDRMALRDGTIIEMNGSEGPSFEGDEWVYAPSRGVNYIGNITNGFANSIFDFTRDYDDNQGYYEIVFANSEKEYFDAFSLINITGAHGFDLLVGTYDENASGWTQVASVPYDMPYIELTPVNTDNNTLIVEENFEEGALTGYSLFVYDPDSSSYTAQYLVQESYESVIVLDRQVVVPAGDEIRLVASAASFDVMPEWTDSAYDHIGIRLKSPSAAARRAIGEVAIGRWVDWSDAIVESNNEIFSNFELVESEYGFLYPELAYTGNLSTNITLTANGLREDSNEYARLFYSVNDLFELERPFPLIIAHTDGIETRFVSVQDGFSNSPDDNHKEIEVPLVDHDWTVGQAPEIKTQRPVIESITVSDSVASPGASLDFEVVAIDPNGLSLQYKWDFGEGTQTSLAGSNNTVSNIYNDLGQYTVQVIVENAEGVSQVGYIIVTLEESGIESYSAFVPTSQSIETDFTISFDALDGSSSLVDDDSSMPVTVDTGRYNQFGVYSEYVNGVASELDYAAVRTLRRGETEFTFRGLANGVYNYTLSDRAGNQREMTTEITGSFPSTSVTQAWSITQKASEIGFVEYYNGSSVERFMVATNGSVLTRVNTDGTVDNTNGLWGSDDFGGVSIISLALFTAENVNGYQQPYIFALTSAGDLYMSDVDFGTTNQLESGTIYSQIVSWSTNTLPEGGAQEGDNIIYLRDGNQTKIRRDPQWSLVESTWDDTQIPGFPAVTPDNTQMKSFFIGRDSTFVVPDQNDNVYILDYRNGSYTELVNSYGSAITAVASDYNGRTIFVASGGAVEAFDRSGNSLWSTTVFSNGRTIRDIDVDKHGELYVGCGMGSTATDYPGVARLDTSGSVVWNTLTDISSNWLTDSVNDLVIDDNTGRVFVVTNSDEFKAIDQS